MRQFIDPRSSRLVRWSGAVICSLILTLVVRLTDQEMTDRANADYSLALARQVASQAEGLALAASQKKIPDPVGWAAFQLGQGVEPRQIQVSPMRGTVLDSTGTNDDGSVEVIKSMNVPDSAQMGGVRITITGPVAHSTGSGKAMSEDLYSGLVFLAIALILGMFLEIRSIRHFSREKHLRLEGISELTPQLRESLLSVGRKIRDIFEHVEVLSAASRDAHENVAHARNLCHDSIQRVRKVLKGVDELSGWTLHAEAAVLNLMLESSKHQGSDPQSFHKIHLLHQQLLELRGKTAGLQNEVRQLEQGLEPVTTDLDIGYEAIAEAQESLRLIPEEIGETTSQITDQARILTKLKQKISG